MPNEATVVINGYELTSAQAMTIRVALEGFSMDLKDADSLGSDAHGKEMRALYFERIEEIRKFLYR